MSLNSKVIDQIGPDEEVKLRIAYANEVYTQLTKGMEMGTGSWEGFSGWRDYVGGKIGEVEFNKRAEAEVRDLTGVKLSAKGIETDDSRKKRIKNANRIYQNICKDSGLSFCFFNNFASWSDYVNAVITEDEFVENARMEMQKIKEEAQQLLTPS